MSSLHDDVNVSESSEKVSIGRGHAQQRLSAPVQASHGIVLLCKNADSQSIGESQVSD